MSELWRDIDKVKSTPHMNWGSCPCSQCCIWRIVAALQNAEARIAELEAEADEHWRTVPIDVPERQVLFQENRSLKARLAAVIALCDAAEVEDYEAVRVTAVRAAATGEGS